MNFEQREREETLFALNSALEANPLNAVARADWIKFQNPDYRLYVVSFESANYAGAGENCMVWATDEDDAMEAATSWAEDFYYQQDSDQYIEENGEDEDVVYANVTSAVLLEGSEFEQYVEDKDQQQAFYQIVN